MQRFFFKINFIPDTQMWQWHVEFEEGGPHLSEMNQSQFFKVVRYAERIILDRPTPKNPHLLITRTPDKQYEWEVRNVKGQLADANAKVGEAVYVVDGVVKFIVQRRECLSLLYYFYQLLGEA